MACLTYTPSKVDFEDQTYSRQQLFENIAGLIEKIDNIYNEIPWHDKSSNVGLSPIYLPQKQGKTQLFNKNSTEI